MHRRAFNVKKSTNTVGEALTWNRRKFDVDESTDHMDSEISPLNRRKITVESTWNFRRGINVESSCATTLLSTYNQRVFHVTNDVYSTYIPRSVPIGVLLHYAGRGTYNNNEIHFHVPL